MELLTKIAIAIVGVIGTGLGSLLVFLVKSYFSKIKEALETLEKKANERAKKTDQILDKLIERQKTLEITVSNIQIMSIQHAKDIARVEGGQDILQKNLSEVVSKVERSTGRIDAAFRFIDGTHRRASDG